MLTAIANRYSLPLFFLLSLVISWAVWVPEAAARLQGRPVSAGSGLLDVVAVWGPGLAAMLVSRWSLGKGGVGALFRPIRKWRVGFPWYLFVLLYPAFVWLLTRGIDAATGRTIPFAAPVFTYFAGDQAYMVVVALVFAFPNALGEELGWRGFALPRLQGRTPALVASLLLGLFWGIWHIPLWIAIGQTGSTMLREIVSLLAVSVLYTWVYNSTGGSLLLVWLFHASATITQYFLQPSASFVGQWIPWAAPVVVVLAAGAKHLSSSGERYRLAADGRGHQTGQA